MAWRWRRNHIHSNRICNDISKAASYGWQWQWPVAPQCNGVAEIVITSGFIMQRIEAIGQI